MGKQLPKNWVEVQLLDILEVLENGSRPKGGVQGIFEGVPSLGGEHLDSNGGFKFGKLKFVPISFAEKMNRGRIKTNDILIVKDGATTGKTSFVSNNFPYDLAFVNEHVFICRSFPNINSKAIFYFLYGKTGFDRIMENFTGSAQGGINQKFATNTLIPLPPLAEQNRIVAKLDTLFAQLETIKTSMAKIPVLLKEFRQQVLTQAVTGKLTEEWRKKKKLGKWENISSSKLFEFVTSGSRGWAQYYDQSGKQLFVRITNMNYGTSMLDLNKDKLQFLKLPDSSEGKRTLLKARDILISITADIGMISLIPENFPYEAYVNQHVCLARPVKTINEQFLVNYLMSEKGFGQLKDRKKGATKAGLNLSDIKDLNIEIPTIEEQQEIVSRVESLFAKADAIERQYQALKEKIDNLPQALLHKAFKGELTEQLESDGDARELLQQIQELKNSSVKPKKATSKKVKKYPENETVLGMVAEGK